MGCEPVDVAEIARRTGNSTVTVGAWVRGDVRGSSGIPFPEPRGQFGKARWWNWPDVEAWIAATEPAWDRRGKRP